MLGAHLPAEVCHSCDLVRETPKFCGVDLHCQKSPDTMAMPTICKSSYSLGALAEGGKLWFWLKPGVLGVHCVLPAKNLNFLGEGFNSCALGHVWEYFPSLVTVLDRSEFRMHQLRMVLHCYTVKLIQVDNGAQPLFFFHFFFFFLLSLGFVN